MRIYLIRHADAVSEDENMPDMYRHLSAEGRREARALAASLAGLGAVVDCIFTSPLARAVQTAELIAGQTHVVTVSALAPLGHLESALEVIAGSGGDAIVVGHEPSIPALGALLTGDNHFGHFHTAEAVLIEDGRLRWRLPPGAKAPVNHP
jgi:phosphohistidine phosphatase